MTAYQNIQQKMKMKGMAEKTTCGCRLGRR